MCPGVTGARPHDASIPAEPENMRHPCSVTSNRLVRHNDRDTHASHIIRIDLIDHTAHVIHDAHDYPNGMIWGKNNNNEA
jgi:hypothetical protein